MIVLLDERLAALVEKGAVEEGVSNEEFVRFAVEIVAKASFNLRLRILREIAREIQSTDGEGGRG